MEIDNDTDWDEISRRIRAFKKNRKKASNAKAEKLLADMFRAYRRGVAPPEHYAKVAVERLKEIGFKEEGENA